MSKRGPVVMMISLWCLAYWSIFPWVNIRRSFRASSGIASRKLSKRYVETYREIDTSTTKSSSRITFAYIVIEVKLESSDSPDHQGVWDAVIQSASGKLSGAPPPLARYTYYVSFYFFGQGQIKIFYQSHAWPKKSVSWCWWLYGPQAGFQEAVVDL